MSNRVNNKSCSPNKKFPQQRLRQEQMIFYEVHNIDELQVYD